MHPPWHLHAGRDADLDPPVGIPIYIKGGARCCEVFEALVIDKKKLAGIFTDGDLRRTLNKVKDPLSKSIDKYMTKKTKTILVDKLAMEALEIMQKNKIYSLAVVDKKNMPVGIIRMHDLIEFGLV